MDNSKKKEKKENINKKLKKGTKKKEKITFTLTEVVIIILIAILFGGVIGSLITVSRNLTDDENLKEFVETYRNVVQEYYKKVDKSKLINSAIKGMVNYLGDPYSTYMDEDDTESFNQTVDGKYDGIGVSVSIVDKKATVVSIFENSPASKAGIKIGDIIINVNGKSTVDKSLDEVVAMIKKSKDKIDLIVIRDGKEKKFKLELSSVVIPSVSSEIINKNDKNVGLISISVFASNTYSQFNKELKSLEKKKIDSLIIDVRDNPGGHLDQVGDIISLFLDKSKVMYQIKSGNKTKKVYAKGDNKREYPIGVLINGNSASASEILAGALQQSYKATVVGIKSYGKGTVQKEYSLKSGSSIKYTTETWLTPNGKSINKKGIVPDEVVELDDKYRETFEKEDDNQLQEALDIVTKDK